MPFLWKVPSIICNTVHRARPRLLYYICQVFYWGWDILPVKSVCVNKGQTQTALLLTVIRSESQWGWYSQTGPELLQRDAGRQWGKRDGVSPVYETEPVAACILWLWSQMFYFLKQNSKVSSWWAKSGWRFGVDCSYVQLSQLNSQKYPYITS